MTPVTIISAATPIATPATETMFKNERNLPLLAVK
jgi:hypothetical protein